MPNIVDHGKISKTPLAITFGLFVLVLLVNLLATTPAIGLGCQEKEYDLSCGVDYVVRDYFSEGTSKRAGHYFRTHNFDVVKGCVYVVEVVSGDFIPVLTIQLPDGRQIKDENAGQGRHIKHEIVANESGVLPVEVITSAAGESGGFALHLVPKTNYSEPPADWFEPYQPEGMAAAENRNSITDQGDAIFFGTLDDGSEPYGDAPADFYTLSVDAGQSLTFNYGPADSSVISGFLLLLITPDGRQVRNEGYQGVSCDVEIKERGEIYLAATSYYEGGSQGHYYVEVLGLDAPVPELLEKTDRTAFMSIMQQFARPLCKSKRVYWGDEAALYRDLDFDWKHFNPGFLEAKIHDLVNMERKDEGLQPYVYHRILNESARQHSEEMAALNYFSHYSPIPEYLNAQKRIYNIFKFQGHGYSENVGFQTKDLEYSLRDLTYEKLAREIMDMWMNSAGHRRAILRKDRHYLGVGCALAVEDGKAYFYYTQNFAGK